ncbi:MAG TPA: fimbria/pilus outer membrane usher protein [Rhizomicrobium sp.]|nr:fimbria/pilus outer membrane usher protein [Rhizomicrobium sp.]
MISAFFQLPDSRIAIRRGDLAEIGIKAPDGPPDDILPLASLGLQYNYDIPHQTIDITLADAQRVANKIDATSHGNLHEPQRSTGAYLNYTAFLSGDFGPGHYGGQLDGGSLSLDGHFFSPIGTFSQSANIFTSTFRDDRVLRLDTSWAYSDPSSLMSYHAGDFISGGLSWTRPIRLGGVQIEQNFNIRPDLITLPLPSLSGSAAVPSTLDVYLGNVKTYSTQIPSGPYQIDNIPVVSGGGVARVVLTDINGRQIETQNAFFTDNRLLREGLFDYSVEAGFLRLDYGLLSFGYDDHPVITATGRMGLTDQITLEAHEEAGDGLVDLGSGARFAVGSLGLVSVATAVSDRSGDVGSLFYGAWDFPTGDFNFHASTQRTVGHYLDLASLPSSKTAPATTTPVPFAEDVVAAGYNLPGTKSSVNFSLVHSSDDLSKSMIVSGSYAGMLTDDISFYASGFNDLDTKNSFGLFVGISVPLGNASSASAGVSGSHSGAAATAEFDRPTGIEPGNYGGRVSLSTGGSTTGYESAYGAYRLDEGLLEGSVTHQSSTTSAYMSFNGALVAGDGGLFTAQRIDDAFAIVNAGAPGVTVLRENQPVGVTDSNGRFLVTGLNSYQENRISIDAADLPLDADIPNTVLRVVPAEKSGVVANFDVQKSVPSATVIFTHPDGSFVAPGTVGRVRETKQPFVIGYDGWAFIKNLKPENTVTLDLAGQPCQVSFAFVASPGQFVTIGPVVCR